MVGLDYNQTRDYEITRKIDRYENMQFGLIICFINK